jgi:hypothetical protein
VGAVSENAVIAVTRMRGGSRDLFRKYLIVIDGAGVAKIKRGQTLELPVTPGRHEVFLKIDWCRSPSIELEASPGQVVELRCAPGGSAREGLGAVVADAKTDYISLTRVESRPG